MKNVTYLVSTFVFKSKDHTKINNHHIFLHSAKNWYLSPSPYDTTYDMSQSNYFDSTEEQYVPQIQTKIDRLNDDS